MRGLPTLTAGAVEVDVGIFSFEALIFTVCAGASFSSFCILARLRRRGLLLAEEVGKVSAAAAVVVGRLNREDVKVVVAVVEDAELSKTVEGTELSAIDPDASSSALFNLCREAFFSESKSFDVTLYPTRGGGGSGY